MRALIYLTATALYFHVLIDLLDASKSNVPIRTITPECKISFLREFDR